MANRYDIPTGLNAAMQPWSTGPDVSSFLTSATQKLNDMATMQKNYARNVASLGGVAGGTTLKDRMSSIDEAASAQANDLYTKVALAKAQQKWEAEQEARKRKEYEDAINQQKQEGILKGVAGVGGMVLGGIPGLVMGGADKLKNVLKGAAIGGETTRGIAGMGYGEEPTFNWMKMLGQEAYTPEDFMTRLRRYLRKDTETGTYDKNYGETANWGPQWNQKTGEGGLY